MPKKTRKILLKQLKTNTWRISCCRITSTRHLVSKILLKTMMGLTKILVDTLHLLLKVAPIRPSINQLSTQVSKTWIRSTLKFNLSRRSKEAPKIYLSFLETSLNNIKICLMGGDLLTLRCPIENSFKKSLQCSTQSIWLIERTPSTLLISKSL